MAEAKVKKPKSIFENIHDLISVPDHTEEKRVPQQLSPSDKEANSASPSAYSHHVQAMNLYQNAHFMDQVALLHQFVRHTAQQPCVDPGILGYRLPWPGIGLPYNPTQNCFWSPAVACGTAFSDVVCKNIQKLPKYLTGTSEPIQYQLPPHPPSSLTLLGNVPGKGPAARQCPRFQCPDCNRSYSTFSGLSKHRQFHCSFQMKKSFSCKFCHKQYSSLGALKMHIRTHTLPCKCDVCGKAFSRPWLLQGHLRTHTGEKPFSCGHCGRGFADRSNLRAHLQTHSDVKKYQCKVCFKTFSRMSLLNKHEGSICHTEAE